MDKNDLKNRYKAYRGGTAQLAGAQVSTQVQEKLDEADRLTKAEQYNEAVAILQPLSDQGDAVAQYKLAFFYNNGKGVPKDDAIALDLMKKAAEGGYATAQAGLGDMYSRGYGNVLNRDPIKAFEWWHKAAANGDTDAQLLLYKDYRNMFGSEQGHDKAKADEFLRKAAEGGNAEAQYLMGFFYDQGTMGGKKDRATAVLWWRKSAAQGYLEAQDSDIGGFYNGAYVDDPQSLEILRAAAEKGEAEAQYQLGMCYEKDDDDDKALEWWRKAAAQGHAGAQYKNAMNLPGDDPEIFGLYKKAAEQGHAHAQYYLAECYADGDHDTEKDPFKAMEWYKKAAEKGHEKAREKMDELPQKLYDEGYAYEKGESKNFEEAAKLYRFAAEMGHDDAQARLALCYFNEDGVEQDFCEAFKWASKAEKQGNAGACLVLAYMYQDGYGVEGDRDKALSFYRRAEKRGMDLESLQETIDGLENDGYCEIDISDYENDMPASGSRLSSSGSGSGGASRSAASSGDGAGSGANRGSKKVNIIGAVAGAVVLSWLFPPVGIIAGAALGWFFGPKIYKKIKGE